MKKKKWGFLPNGIRISSLPENIYMRLHDFTARNVKRTKSLDNS